MQLHGAPASAMCRLQVVFVACLAAVTSASVQGHSFSDVARKRISRNAEPHLIFNNATIEVQLDSRLALDCGVEGGDDYSCIWESDKLEIIEVRDVHGGDVYDSYIKPEDLTNNQCGVWITSAEMSHNAVWSCKATVDGKVLSDSKRVRVTNNGDSGAMANILSPILLVFCVGSLVFMSP